MFALRERRMHVTQEDFEMAVAKVMKKVGLSFCPVCPLGLALHLAWAKGCCLAAA